MQTDYTTGTISQTTKTQGVHAYGWWCRTVITWMWSMRSPLLVNFCIRLLRQSTTMISSRGVHVTPHEDRPSSELQSSTCHNTHTTPIQHPHNTHTISTQHPHNIHTTSTQHPHTPFTCHNTHTLYLPVTTPTQHPHSPFTCHNTHTLHSGATTPTLSIQVPQHQHSSSGAT